MHKKEFSTQSISNAEVEEFCLHTHTDTLRSSFLYLSYVNVLHIHIVYILVCVCVLIHAFLHMHICVHISTNIPLSVSRWQNVATDVCVYAFAFVSSLSSRYGFFIMHSYWKHDGGKEKTLFLDYDVQKHKNISSSSLTMPQPEPNP